MSSSSNKLPKLKHIKPIKFPSSKTIEKQASFQVTLGGQSTKKVIAEMKKLSKQGIYISE